MWELIERDGRWYVTRGGEPVGPDDGFPSADAAGAFVSSQARQTLQADDEQRPMLRRFAMPILIPEGVETSDGRTINSGATEWREPPLPVMFQTETEVGHFGARLAGTIDRVDRDGDTVQAFGFLHDSEPGRELGDLLDAQDRFGVSADLADLDAEFECVEFDDDGWCEDGILIVSRAELMGATATPFPAFADAHIVLDGDEPDAEAAAVAAVDGGERQHAALEVIGAVDLPVADRDTDWDGAGAASRVFDLCTDGEDVDVACVSRAFLYRDPDEDGTAQSHYSLGFADVIDGQLQIVPAGVAATAGGRGVSAVEGLSDDERDAIQTRICSLYDVLSDRFDDWPDCPFADDEMADQASQQPSDRPAGDPADQAAVQLVAAGVPDSPPSWWFDDPGLEGPTPLTVTDDGRIFGHAAQWGTCHIGFDGVCVTPPKSRASYAYFATGEVVCDDCDGTSRPVGVVTMATGHANERLDARAAAAHYDDTGTAVADVAVGEDAHGVWVAGAVRPSIMDDAERLRALRASSLSGDWRRLGGNLELVALLAVNVPGFPIRRLAASGDSRIDLTPRAGVHDGVQTALVASGIVPPSADDGDDGTAVLRRIAARQLRSEVAPSTRAVRQRRADRLADLRQRVHADDG